MSACYNGHQEAARLLLEHGAALERADDVCVVFPMFSDRVCDCTCVLLQDEGITPLLYACSSGNDELVKLLLQQDALLHPTDSVSASPLLNPCRANGFTERGYGPLERVPLR